MIEIIKRIQAILIHDAYCNTVRLLTRTFQKKQMVSNSTKNENRILRNEISHHKENSNWQNKILCQAILVILTVFDTQTMTSNWIMAFWKKNLQMTNSNLSSYNIYSLHADITGTCGRGFMIYDARYFFSESHWYQWG